MAWNANSFPKFYLFLLIWKYLSTNFEKENDSVVICLQIVQKSVKIKISMITILKD